MDMDRFRIKLFKVREPISIQVFGTILFFSITKF